MFTKVLLVAILLVQSSLAFAKLSCGEIMLWREDIARKFETVIGDLDARGMRDLTGPYHSGAIKLVTEQASEDGVDISIGRKSVVVSALDLSNERTRQWSVWQVGEALFKLQLAADLKTLSLNQRPGNWRSEAEKKIAAHEGRLRVLLNSLNLIRGEDVFPASSSRGLMWQYYVRHTRRMVTIGLTLLSLAQIPQAVSIAHQQFWPSTQQTQTLNPLEQDIIRDSHKLINGIHYQLKRPMPDLVSIQEMRDELANLHAQSPKLVGPDIP